MNIELVVFDLAGTTVKDDRDVHKVLQKSLAEFGIAISLEDANEVMGIPKPVAIRLLLEQKKMSPVNNKFIDDIHRKFIAEMIHFYQHDGSVGEKDGVSETFRELKSLKIKVAVDTGFDRSITNALLNRLGWVQQKLIDCSVTSDEVLHGRPHPDLIYRVMELTQVTDVKKVAKVGDTAFDLQEGNAAGCGLVVGITSGAFSIEQLQKERYTHLIHEIPQMLEILKTEFVS
jgi:phosphonatase-like hydrolase